MIAGKVLRIVCNLLKYGNKNSSGGVVWMFRGRQRFAEMKRSVQLLLYLSREVSTNGRNDIRTRGFG